MKLKASLIIIFSISVFLLQAQNEQNSTADERISFGLLVDGTIVKQKIKEGDNYYPTLIQLSFRLPLLHNKSRSQIALFFQPQFNPVNHIENQSSKLTFEAGLTIGVAYERLTKSEKGIIFAALSLSPHYINLESEQQAKGFIFSDNLSFGYHQLLGGNQNWFFTYEIKFRHLSNASINYPNISLNNILLGVGISRFLSKKK